MNITSTILKELRIKKNITLEQLALEINEKFNINITRSMLSKWETGKSTPVYDHLKRLALYYNVTTDYLLGFDQYENLNVITCDTTIDTSKKRIRNSKRHYTIKAINELFEDDDDKMTNNELLLVKDFVHLIKSRKHNYL